MAAPTTFKVYISDDKFGGRTVTGDLNNVTSNERKWEREEGKKVVGKWDRGGGRNERKMVGKWDRGGERNEGKGFDIKSYIGKDGDIDIPFEVISSTDEMAIQKGLAWAIRSGKLRFPYRKYLDYDPEVLIENQAKTKIVEWKYMHKIRPGIKYVQFPFDGEEIACVYFGGDYIEVNQIPDFYTEEARMNAHVKGHPPPIDGWLKKSVPIAESAVRRAKYHNIPINKETMSESVFMGGVKVCTLYKAATARVFYEYFNAKTVYCPCFGWGCRAIGAIMSDVTTYCYGCDPNAALIEGYQKIAELGKKRGTKIEFSNLPMEEFPLEDYPPADLVFSSPPFSCHEIYSKSETQSVSRHPIFDDWLRKWFIPQTIRCIYHMKRGGHLIYYLAGVGVDIIGPMIAALNIEGIKFRGGIPSVCSYGERDPINHFVFEKTLDFNSLNDLQKLSTSALERYYRGVI